LAIRTLGAILTSIARLVAYRTAAVALRASLEDLAYLLGLYRDLFDIDADFALRPIVAYGTTP